MNLGINFRLAALGLAMSLMGASIVVVTLTLQHRAEVVRVRLGQMDQESFRVADSFKDKLRYANDNLRRYGSTEEAAAWDEFLKACDELKAWMAAERARLTSSGEQQVLNRMDAEYASYLRKAEDLRATVTSDNRRGASLAEFNGFLEQSRRFLDVSQDLARTHYELRSDVVAHTNRTLTQLRMSLLVFVGLLFLFGIALAVGVYQYLIAPLKVKLVESQALVERQEKLASLGLLAAGVAHEIRNPLTAIKTALFTHQRKMVPGSADHEDAELIGREISRLERIVNNFLLFARPARPEPAELAADLPLQEVQTLLSPTLEEAGIRLVREESPPLRLRADPAQLKQALINLVQNAADSVGKAGTVTLRARAAGKRLSNGVVESVVLEVADTGRGIPPEVEKRLCDPFFTTKDTGTGLGLAIAARLVEMNGGALQYQTQVNRGSTFGIILPRVLATNGQAQS